jgi:hypothetical protein
MQVFQEDAGSRLVGFAATLSVLTVVEAAHVPIAATIKAATANELVLRIWGPPANEPRHAAAQLMVTGDEFLMSPGRNDGANLARAFRRGLSE